MDPRQELDRLRKMKRLKELEAKAGGSPVDTPAAPAQEAMAAGTPSPAETFVKEAADPILAGYTPQIAGGVRNATDSVIRGLGRIGVGPYAGIVDKVPETSYLQERDAFLKESEQGSKANPRASIAGKVAGLAGSIALPGAGAGSLAKTAALSGAQAAAYNPGDTVGKIDAVQGGDRLKNLIVGAAMPAAFAGAKNVAMTGADKLMRSAAGFRKPAEGLGNELVEQGIVGTKGMMREQVANRIPQRVQDLQKATAAVTDDVSLGPVADRLSAAADSLSPGGVTPANLMGDKVKYQELAEQLANKDRMSFPELLKFKQLQGDVAHNASGTPGASYAADVAKQAMRGADDQLTAAYAAARPGEANAYKEANKSLSALYKARKGLDLSPSLTNQLLAGGLGAGGIAASGPAGVLAGLANTSAAKSLLAHGLQRGVAPAAEAGKKISPVLLKSLLEGIREEK